MQYCTRSHVAGCLATTLAAFLLAPWGIQAWGQEAAPDFFLPDVNDTSPTYGTDVSPRNYLGQVSGWYFGLGTGIYCRAQFERLNLMQHEFDTDYPHLDIQILGINLAGYGSGNGWFTSSVDIPWLQDADTNGDSQSDVWVEWQVSLDDVVILDEENVPAGSINLADHNLYDWENYIALRQMFISTATSADFDLDGDVDGSDFLVWQRGEVSNPPSAEDLADWEALFGTTNTLSSSTTVPEPSSIMLLLAAIACGLRWRRLI